MTKTIRQLYPEYKENFPLEHLYLNHDLRGLAKASESAFVYANFITSLDGRIAVSDPAQPGLRVPTATANDRDWRLFQELAAQADVLLSSGRYLREFADGIGQNLFEFYDNPAYADLLAWRREQGLGHPVLAFISGSLRLTIPEMLIEGGHEVVVATSAGADPDRISAIEKMGASVLFAGENGKVDGAELVAGLHHRGYRTIYSTAGPRILHLLLSGNALDRLYLTTANRILGGLEYASFVEGEFFGQARGFQLKRLYFDPEGLEGHGQLFAVYDRASG